MLGLGAYASSDEGEDDIEMKDEQDLELKVEVSPTANERNSTSSIFESSAVPPDHMTDSVSMKHQESHGQNESSPNNTEQGPSMPQNQPTILETSSNSGLTEKEVIRNLTMPPAPNFDIPPSPTGSPPSGSTKKFEHFLKLKKQGIHFNSKLESSSALRNPALLQKLLEFAKIDEWDQYASALPSDLGVPTSYPPWAYGDELNKTQIESRKSNELRGSKSTLTARFEPAAVARPTARVGRNNAQTGSKRRAHP